MFRPWLKEPEEPIALYSMTTFTSTQQKPTRRRCEAEIITFMQIYVKAKWWQRSKRLALEDAIYWTKELNDLLTDKKIK